MIDKNEKKNFTCDKNIILSELTKMKSYYEYAYKIQYT